MIIPGCSAELRQEEDQKKYANYEQGGHMEWCWKESRNDVMRCVSDNNDEQEYKQQVDECHVNLLSVMCFAGACIWHALMSRHPDHYFLDHVA